MQGIFYHHGPIPDPTKEIAAVKATLHKSLKDTAQSRSQGKKYDKVVEPDKEPDDDDAPREYEKSQKHPDYKTVADIEKFLAKGISPSPQNGQAMLDISLYVKPGARVAMQNGYFIIFYRTGIKPQGGSVYHGFIESWDKFKSRDKHRNTLQKNGLITQSGKIL